MQVENEVVLERLVQGRWACRRRASNINSPKYSIGVILLWKNWNSLWIQRHTFKTGRFNTPITWNAWLQLYRSCLRFLITRQIAKIQSTHVIGLRDWILNMGRSCYLLQWAGDLTQTVSLSGMDPNLQNTPVCLSNNICKAFGPRRGKTVPCLFWTIHKSNCASWPIFREMSIWLMLKLHGQISIHRLLCALPSILKILEDDAEWPAKCQSSKLRCL